MKKLIVFVALLLSLFAFSCRREKETSGAVPHRLDGTPTTVAMGNGVTLLHFWATWCGPCREELPMFQRFAERSRQHGITVVPVAVEPDARGVAAYLSKNEIALDSLFDPTGDFATNYGVDALPTTLVLDRRGKVVNKFIGMTDWDAPEINAQLKALAAAQ
jgi:thiol-disulfide isomerase/thioredoxin